MNLPTEYEDFPVAVREAHEVSKSNRFEYMLGELSELITSSTGSIAMVTGPMFSGKSSFFYELRKLNDLLEHRKSLHFFKPAADDRQRDIFSRDYADDRIQARRISNALEIFGYVKEYDLDLANAVFCIDEAQFCDEGIIDVIRGLRFRGSHVILCGLDTDFRGRPFPLAEIQNETRDRARALLRENGLDDNMIKVKTMGDIMAISNLIVKICARDEKGNQATHSMRYGAEHGDSVNQTGDSDIYRPVSVSDHNLINPEMVKYMAKHGL